MRNICRPIILYNKMVPPSPNKLDYDYLIFGDYDGLSVKENIYSENKNDLIRLWYDMVEEAKRLDGNYVYRTIFGFRSEEECDASDEAFQGLTEHPFLFISMLQFKEKHIELRAKRQCIETSINECYEELGASAICYLTIDNATILLMIKAKTYELGAQAFHYFRYHCYDICGLTLNYSYTINGYSQGDLNNELYLDDEAIVDEAVLNIIENSPGSVWCFYEELKRQLLEADKPKVKNLSLYSIFGNDDMVIRINEIRWCDLLPLYRNKGKGLLLNECDGYIRCVYNITTTISIRQEEHDNGLARCPVEIDTPIEDDFTEHCASVFDEHRNRILSNNDKKAKGYSKALLIILNSLQKYEKSDFSKYIFLTIYDPVNTFIEMVYDENYSKLIVDHQELEFINAVNIQVQNTIGACRSFFEAPDFNAAIYYSPVKLNALYASYAFYVTERLRMQTDSLGSEYNYKFMICPWMQEQIICFNIFEEGLTDKNVILLKIPERLLYQPRDLMIMLTHEIAHFVGEGIRNRIKRYDCFVNIMINSIISYIKGIPFLMDFVAETDFRTVKEFLNQKLRLKSERYIESKRKEDPQYLKYRYTLVSTKDELNNVIRGVIRDHKKDLFLMFKSNYYSKHKEKLQSLYSDIYKSEYNRENIQSFKKEQYTILEYEKAWEDAVFKLLYQYSESLITPGINLISQIFSETYADLISVMTLGLTPLDYISTFFRMKDKNTSLFFLTIRITFVVIAMSIDELKSKVTYTFQNSWREEWGELLKRYSQNDSDTLAKTICTVDSLIRSFNKEDLSGIIAEENITKENYIFHDYATWDWVIQYLAKCRQDYEQCLSREKEEADFKQFLSFYQDFGHHDIEYNIAQMEEMIDKYMENVYSRLH